MALMFPSVEMLPIEDIITQLKLNFLEVGNKSVDTEEVAGESADNIAIAYKNEEGIVEDRNTVKNAMKLGGLDAKDYLTKTQGTNIETFTQDLNKVLVDEITNLRDELYQLRGELTRNGFVKEYGLYAGFQDYFNTENKKYVYTTTAEGDTIAICKLSSSFVNSSNVTKIIPSQSGLIKVNDWFVISKTDTGENYLVQAVAINRINMEEEITFRSSLSIQGIPSIDNPLDVIITKVQGSYINGTFSFSNVAAQAITGKEKYTMLNDDTSVLLRNITSDQSGYAIQFKVPNNIAGALKEFHIVARANGVPGPLTCYMIDVDKYSNITDVTTEEIGEDKNVLAKSTPIFYEAANSINLTELSFKFYNPETYTYPIIEGKNYIFLIVAEMSSTTNYWEVQFTTNDVQTNNVSYIYGNASGLVMNTSINDMIFSLTTIEIETNVETPYNEGLYTSKTIKVNDDEHLSRARLTLRINKEGDYRCKTNGLINDNGIIRIDPVGDNPDNLGIDKNDILIIGTQIRKAETDCDNNNVVIDKGILIEDNAEIYRIGYQPYLKAVKTTWNKETLEYDISNEVFVPLKLKTVIKDDFKQSENRSDRLIFEGDLKDLDGNLLDVNEFVLQIVWKSNLTNAELKTYDKYIGRIYDLTLSFDKTL